MELLAILRILWARRMVAGLGIVLAVGAGMLAGQKAEKRVAGGGGVVSSLAVMLDTSRSQLVAAAPIGASTLATRAALLADSLSTGTATAMVARRAGVPRDQLAMLGPATWHLPPVDTPLVSQVYQAASQTASPYVVSVFADELTPIIKVEAAAPDSARATRLAQAAETALRSLLVAEDGHGTHGFVLHTVAQPHAKQVVTPSSHSRLIMVAGTLATLAFWCACVVLASGVARRLAANAPRVA